ncbi:MAG: hypothetical protein ACLUB2_04160 [Butyricicoccus pullicaecorum]
MPVCRQAARTYSVDPIQTIRSLPGVNVVLCTHGAFIECDDDLVVRNAHMYMRS